jgi:hypothetical protein
MTNSNSAPNESYPPSDQGVNENDFYTAEQYEEDLRADAALGVKYLKRLGTIAFVGLTVIYREEVAQLGHHITSIGERIFPG